MTTEHAAECVGLRSQVGDARGRSGVCLDDDMTGLSYMHTKGKTWLF